MPDPRESDAFNRALDSLAGSIMEREPESILRAKLALAFNELRKEILAEVKKEGRRK